MSRPQAGLRAQIQADQRTALFGRLRMADWIEMPEREFAREIERVEKDPLFRKLHFGTGSRPGFIRRQRWPSGRCGSSIFEAAVHALPSRQHVQVEEIVDRRQALLPKIQELGREAFERYFLYAEEALPLAEIARRTGFAEEEIREINDLLVEFGAQAEFAGPAEAAPASAYASLAAISLEQGEPALEFHSPYWARGRYQIRYDLLDEWKRSGLLDGRELKQLPRLLRKIETLNLRQNTIYRVLESLCRLQAKYLKSRREELMRPISLQQLARQLELSPSTVSRAAAGRSVRLPWGREVPLIALLPGRRRVLRRILALWLEEEGPRGTDAGLAARLRQEFGISVSRRTVNAVRLEAARGKS
ncbi:MAG: hypothetical protein HY926_08285 [Elusimicrobia bacterium]|nr:hypothetical protein [Elusimicrobiota bacterium]